VAALHGRARGAYACVAEIAGYGLLAWLVLHRGWYEWLGVEQPD